LIPDVVEDVTTIIDKNPNPAAKAQALIWVVRCLKSPKTGPHTFQKDKNSLKTLVNTFTKVSSPDQSAV